MVIGYTHSKPNAGRWLHGVAILGCVTMGVMGTTHGVLPASSTRAEQEGATVIVDGNHPDANDSGPGTAQAPLRTMGKAVAAVKPGLTILVKGGVYREQVELTVSGTADKPIVLKAAPGERVIVSGPDPYSVDCGNACWMLRTEDERLMGKLGAGFRRLRLGGCSYRSNGRSGLTHIR